MYAPIIWCTPLAKRINLFTDVYNVTSKQNIDQHRIIDNGKAELLPM